MAEQTKNLWLALLGILLIVTAIFLVFWNEGISFRGAKSAQINGYEIFPTANSPADFKNNNKLIYTTGKLNTNVALRDPLLEVSEKAIKIERQVEMYQWSQSENSKREKLPDGSDREIVTYLYTPVWSKELIDSDAFKDAVSHRNPVSMPVGTLKGQAEPVTLGDFQLSPELLALLPGDEVVDLSNVDLTALQRTTNKTVHHDGKFIFIGTDPKKPAIGDVRISIRKVAPQAVSIIAQQSDNMLHPLNVQGSKPIVMLVPGQQSLNEMLQQDKKENKILTWLIPSISLVLILIGTILIVSNLNLFLSLGIGLATFIIGFGIWSFVMMIVWFIVKPYLAITLLILAAIIYLGLFAMLRRRFQRVIP